MTAAPARWRIAEGQRFAFEEFDDGILVFDHRVGGTHLVSPTAAEALDLLAAVPDLTASEIQAHVAARLELAADALPLALVEELLERLADLCIVARGRA